MSLKALSPVPSFGCVFARVDASLGELYPQHGPGEATAEPHHCTFERSNPGSIDDARRPPPKLNKKSTSASKFH